jgi:hypothetical protein
MGAIADQLRSTLRGLAQAEARLYRGLAQAEARLYRGLATELSATATSRAALPGDDIAAAIALLERHGYTITPPGGHHG